MTFDTSKRATVEVKVALSFVDEAGARANLRAPKAKSWNVATVRNEAAAAWQRALARIRIEGGSPVEQRTFYSAVYHVLLHPNLYSDAKGLYRGFDGKSITFAPAPGIR